MLKNAIRNRISLFEYHGWYFVYISGILHVAFCIYELVNATNFSFSVKAAVESLVLRKSLQLVLILICGSERYWRKRGFGLSELSRLNYKTLVWRWNVIAEFSRKKCSAPFHMCSLHVIGCLPVKHDKMIIQWSAFARECSVLIRRWTPQGPAFGGPRRSCLLLLFAALIFDKI